LGDELFVIVSNHRHAHSGRMTDRLLKNGLFQNMRLQT